MNLLIGTMGANLTVGLVSGMTAVVNGIYTLKSNIMHSTANGSTDIKKIIKETDLEVKIRTAQLIICELKIDSTTPYTIQYCIQKIKDSIHEISDELEKIYYRMQYNDNLWFGMTVRSYKFHNCKERLNISLKNLESRCEILMRLTKLDNVLVKNDDLSSEFTKSIIHVQKNDTCITKKTNSEIHKKILYINDTSHS